MRNSFAIVIAGFMASVVWADPPTEEKLPPPRPLPTRTVIQPIPYRVSAYEVWQNYGIDRSGKFRPRVIYSDYGSYYYANGAPFPWVETHTRDFSQTIGNAANFAGRIYEPIIVTDPHAYMPYAED